MAPAFASFSLSLPPAAAAGRVAAGGVSFSSSSSFGQVLGLVCVERKVAVLPRLAFSVRSNGGFIPAEHRWMHKGIENKGDVRRIVFFSRLCVLICLFLHPRRIASSCRGTSSLDFPFLSCSFSEFFVFSYLYVSFSVVCVSLSLRTEPITRKLQTMRMRRSSGTLWMLLTSVLVAWRQQCYPHPRQTLALLHSLH